MYHGERVISCHLASCDQGEIAGDDEEEEEKEEEDDDDDAADVHVVKAASAVTVAVAMGGCFLNCL